MFYLVYAGIAPVRDDALDLLESVVFVPHGATVAHHTRHARVDDDVTRHVEVGDSLSDFTGRKKGRTFPPHPHLQQPAIVLSEHLERWGLMVLYLDIGTVPVSGLKYFMVIG